MKRNNFSFFILLIFIAANSCSKQKISAPLANEDIILNDVSFGTDTAQRMDVYLPKNRGEATRTIIYIHGGGWFQGNKKETTAAVCNF